MKTNYAVHAGTSMSEIEQALDLSILRYSRVDEDYRVLSRALQICPEDIILSITR